MLKTNIEKLVTTLKSTNPAYLGYDEQGRLLIKSDRLTRKSKRGYLGLSGGDVRLPCLKKQTLYPEDRIIKKPLVQWIAELSEGMRFVASHANRYLYASRIAEIYNNAAYVCFAQNEIALAKEICYSQIQLFLESSSCSRGADHLKYVVQPWINLCRIDRIQGDVTSAIDKLQALNMPDVLGKSLGLTPKTFHAAIVDDSDTNRLMQNCRLIELVKVYFQMNRYDDVISLIDNDGRCIDKSIVAFKYEAKIIAYAYLNRIDAAFLLIDEGLAQLHPGMMHIFKLRECELHSWLSSQDGMAESICSLASLAVKLIQAKYVNLNDINFALHVSYVATLSGLNDVAGQLGYFCLKSIDKLGDELLKADCLIALYQSMLESEGRRIIEDLMIVHYFNTKYCQAKIKMLQCFEGLRHVDSQESEISLSPLTDLLLSFSIV